MPVIEFEEEELSMSLLDKVVDEELPMSLLEDEEER